MRVAASSLSRAGADSDPRGGGRRCLDLRLVCCTSKAWPLNGQTRRSGPGPWRTWQTQLSSASRTRSISA